MPGTITLTRAVQPDALALMPKAKLVAAAHWQQGNRGEASGVIG